MGNIFSLAPAIFLSGIFIPFFAMAAVVPVPEVPVVVDNPPEAAPNTGDGLRTFRANASGQSDISALALLKLLRRLEPGESQQFVNEQCFPIAEMVTGLMRMADSKSLSSEEYLSISSELASFDIRVSGYGGHGPPDRRGPGHDKRNLVDDLVDVRSVINSGDTKAAHDKLRKFTQT